MLLSTAQNAMAQLYPMLLRLLLMQLCYKKLNSSWSFSGALVNLFLLKHHCIISWNSYASLMPDTKWTLDFYCLMCYTSVTFFQQRNMFWASILWWGRLDSGAVLRSHSHCAYPHALKQQVSSLLLDSRLSKPDLHELFRWFTFQITCFCLTDLAILTSLGASMPHSHCSFIKQHPCSAPLTSSYLWAA